MASSLMLYPQDPTGLGVFPLRICGIFTFRAEKHASCLLEKNGSNLRFRVAN